MTKKVHITIEGGVIQHVDVPSGVKVVIRDYDYAEYLSLIDRCILLRKKEIVPDDDGFYYRERVEEPKHKNKTHSKHAIACRGSRTD